MSLILVRSMMGLVSAPLHPSCARTVSAWVPAGGQALANGLVNGFALLGVATAPLLFGTFVLRLGWPAAFVINGAFTALLAMVWMLYSTDRPASHPSANEAERILLPPAGDKVETISWPEFFRLLKLRSLVLLTLSYAAVGYFQYLFFYWMHYYFQTILKLEETRSLFYAGIPTLVMAVTMPLGGFLSDRLQRRLGIKRGRRLIAFSSMSASAVLLLFGLAATNPSWIVFWFSLSLGAVGLSEGAFWTTAVELGGPRGGTAAAICNTGGNGIGLLAPIITPWLGASLGWLSGIAVGAGVIVFGAVLWLWIDPEDSAERS